MLYRIVKIVLLFFAVIFIAGASTYVTLTFFIKFEDTVVVPDLLGKDVVYVLQILTDLGLNTKVKGSEYSTEIPINHVIFQEPLPGAEIKKDRDIRIVISKGTRSVLMPNLKGLTLSQARIILEENGLCSGEQSLTHDPAIRKDDIVAHDPRPGSRVDRGNCVSLLVSMGRRLNAYRMPDFKGKSLDETVLRIEENRFKIGDIKHVFQKHSPRNIIVYQDPMPGYRVFEGARVHLSVNRKVGETERAVFEGIGGIGLFRYRLENGFLKRRIRIRLNSYGVSTDLFNDFLKPGEEVWHFVPKRNDATILLYVDGELIKTELF